jgi:histone-lysine N-methyltransferase NSD2
MKVKQKDLEFKGNFTQQRNVNKIFLYYLGSNWRCPDCINGKRPLYGDVVWAKVGQYRWWPAQVCHPRHLVGKIRDKPGQVGEFAVRFFGTEDNYWVSYGRCFLFAVGDEFQRNAGAGKQK